MKVLVVGSGGREHALCWKLSSSPLLTKLYCAPGNGGTSQVATNVAISPGNKDELVRWAKSEGIELTIVGPEAPLADGLVDTFRENGLRIFGPTQAASQLESSKAFAKEVMLKAGVRTAAGRVFSDFNSAKAYVEAHPHRVVVKADGLAAGKGVVVPATKEETIAALESFLIHDRFGTASKSVVIEDRLEGREASVIVIIDGETVRPFTVSSDYKRIFDGDKGPNTGGMGAISPTPVLSDTSLSRCVEEIFVPVIKELQRRDIRYQGFLYAGVMVDSDGIPSVIEFNCRLGDPEAEVLMMRLSSDLLGVLDMAERGELSKTKLNFVNQGAACVVLASRGYPDIVQDGKVISGLVAGDDKCQIFHAGTNKDLVTGNIVSKGGRVLVVTALGQDVSDAVVNAYSQVGKISFEGMQYRRDIGKIC